MANNSLILTGARLVELFGAEHLCVLNKVPQKGVFSNKLGKGGGRGYLDAANTAATIDKAISAGHNIGVALRRMDPSAPCAGSRGAQLQRKPRYLDVDVDPQDDPRAVESARRLLGEFGGYFAILSGKHDNAETRGWHALFEIDGDVSVRRHSAEYPGLAVASVGHVVAPGSRHCSGVRYRLAGADKIGPVPAIVLDAFSGTETKPVGGEMPKRLLAAAMEACPPQLFRETYSPHIGDEWRHSARCMWKAWGASVEEYAAWAARDPNYRDGAVNPGDSEERKFLRARVTRAQGTGQLFKCLEREAREKLDALAAEEGWGEKKNDLRAMLAALDVEIMANTRSQRFEARMSRPAGDGVTRTKVWRSLTDQDAAAIRGGLKERFVAEKTVYGKVVELPLEYGSREQFDDALMRMVASPGNEDLNMDPFVTYARSRAEAPGAPRYENWISDLFETDESVPAEILRWASRYCFLGAVQRAFDPGCLLREVPILISSEKAGKGSALQAMLPARRRADWFIEGVSFAETDKQFTERVFSRVLVELSEMEGLLTSQLARVKNRVSTRVDVHRMPYARFASEFPRRCVFVGTANPDQALPNSIGGNTRFIPVVLKKGVRAKMEPERFMAERADSYWAQAVRDYDAGLRANLPEELRETQRVLTEEHRERDEAREAVLTKLENLVGKTDFNVARTARRHVDASGELKAPEVRAWRKAAEAVGYTWRRTTRVNEATGKRVQAYVLEGRLRVIPAEVEEAVYKQQ